MIQVSKIFPIMTKPGSEHWLYFSSDWHADAPDFDLEKFREQHEEAKAKNAHGIFYGDLLELIDVHDTRRYNKADDRYKTEDEMNEAYKYAWQLVGPYVDMYDIMGVGNHETNALKFKRQDLIRRIVETANEKRDREKRPYPMIHGGYVGMVRFHFTDGKHYWNVDVFWSHGQGGSNAEISRGEIDLSRYAMWVNADIIALGHKHQYKFSGLPPIYSLNRSGSLVRKRRRGLITAPFKKMLEPQDYLEEGYKRKFESERFRVPTASEGGMFAQIKLNYIQGEPITKIRIMEA